MNRFATFICAINSLSKLVCLGFFLLLVFKTNLYSQYTLDTLETKPVGPGVMYYKFNIPSGPFKVDLLKVDLNNPFIRVETVKSLDKLASGREKTTDMSIRRNSVGHWSVGAVNADFFDLASGRPINIQVVKGELLRPHNPGYPVVSFDSLDRFSISLPTFSGKFILSDTVLTVSAINEPRAADQLVVFNSYFGNSTGSDNSGSEYILTPLESYRVNDTVTFRVDSIRKQLGNTSLQSGKTLISVSGNFASALNNRIVKGTIVKLLLNTLPGINNTTEALGGHPIVVTNGSVANLNASDPFVTARHPRTAIGFSADSTIMYLVTVDGRQLPTTVGMDLYELADLMMQFGAHTAMNFDGGGSTTMVVRNEVKNSPSDPGGERAVANALLVVSTAPLGAINNLNLTPGYSRLFKGDTLQFSLNATDIYYNPITVNPTQAAFTLSKPSLGTINSSGVFVASQIPDSGYVYVTYQNVKDSAFIVVKGVGFIKLHPQKAVVDNLTPLIFSVNIFDTDSIQQIIPFQNFSWTVKDTLIGKIDVLGQFRGIKSGDTKVFVKYQTFNDSAEVSVQIGYGFSIIDSIEYFNRWSLLGQNIDSANTIISMSSQVVSLGDSSLRLDYSFTYQASQYNWAFLNIEKDIFGVPDSLIVDFYSNGAPHRVFFDIIDVQGSVFRIMTHKIANKLNQWDALRGPFPKSSNIIYPVKLKTIAIPLGSGQVAGQVYNGTIFIDYIRVKYASVSSLKDESMIIENSYKLFNNYPNPFNPETRIQFNIPERSLVVLEVYNALGQLVKTLTNKEMERGNYTERFSADKLSSGIYFCSLKAVSTLSGKIYTSTNKMLYLK